MGTHPETETVFNVLLTSWMHGILYALPVFAEIHMRHSSLWRNVCLSCWVLIPWVHDFEAVNLMKYEMLFIFLIAYFHTYDDLGDC